jgi:hypothetical protein
MAFLPLPPAVSNTYKKTVDVLGIVNEADILASTYAQLQHKCLFDIIIISEPGYSGIRSGIAAVSSALMVRKNLYAINDIPLFGLDYQRSGGFQFIKDSVYPDSFSCTFLENNMGTVKGYLRSWLNEIAIYDSKTRDYIFDDNQEKSKKIAIIIPQSPDVLPGTEWIRIEGMKLKAITGIGYDHASGENEIITAEFSCDNIRLIGYTVAELIS